MGLGRYRYVVLDRVWVLLDCCLSPDTTATLYQFRQ